jgi:hypothetical protein
MFGTKKLKINDELWGRIKQYAEIAGYSSPEEFVLHVLEKEFESLKEADSNDAIKEKLKGLGYIS